MPAVTSVKIGRTPTYLFRKGNIYYFRIAIPIDVRQVFGRTEINYSLQTDDLYQARVKASILSTLDPQSYCKSSHRLSYYDGHSRSRISSKII